MSRKHNVDEVIRSLSRKRDCKIDVERKHIYILSNDIYSKEVGGNIPNPAKAKDLGNGSWGKIDFLVNYQGYRTTTIGSFKNLSL